MLTYVDSSVLLAAVLVEDRAPDAPFWDGAVISSRLLTYEVWTRINPPWGTETHAESARAFLDRIDLLEMTPPVLARALEPFPVRVRTLDALHLASAEYLRAQGQRVRLASYDRRMRQAARRLKIPLYRL